VTVMRTIIRWLLGVFGVCAVSRKLSRTTSRIEQLEVAREKSLRRLALRGEELRVLASAVERDIENAERLHKRYESALEEEREKCRVHETTIQTLVASHRVLMERYDTEASIAAKARALSSIKE